MNDSQRVAIFEKMTLLTEIVCSETQLLCELVDFIDDADMISKKIASLETEADSYNHDLKNYYRDNDLAGDEEALGFFQLFSKLEECTDVVDDLAASIVTFNITELREEMVQDLVSIDSCSLRISQLVDSITHNSPFIESRRLIIAINHFRDNATKNCAANMRELFTNEKDPIEIIRWKEVLINISEVFSTFEHFADICEEYLLKKG